MAMTGKTAGGAGPTHVDVDAIEVIVKKGDYASEELRDLERQALRLATYRSPYPVLPIAGNAETSSAAPYGRVIHCLEGVLDELLASEIVGSCMEPVVHSEGVVIANVGGYAARVPGERPHAAPVGSRRRGPAGGNVQPEHQRPAGELELGAGPQRLADALGLPEGGSRERPDAP